MARYDGAPSGADRAYSIATSLDGSEVLVTGTSRGNTGYFATLAYSA